MAEPMEHMEATDAYFSTPAMSASFSPQAHVRGMLAFEAALARAEARAGVIPQDAASAIAARCRVELYDIAALYREAATAGTAAIPLVRMLTARVQGNAQKYVHWGATSQDAIDTALMLQMCEGLDLLVEGLLNICAVCASLAEQHRGMLMVGRTLLQQALPMTFGLKAARWLSLTMRQVQALRERRKRSCAVQLGGAAGTLASLGDQGLKVVTLLAEELDLPAPDLPWHTERDRVAEIATTVGIMSGAMAKIAQDVVLMAQTEVGEVMEGTVPGKGGSSAMPQKHNPVDATRTLASARLAIGVVPVILNAMVQEHERAVGGWQAEWAALPELFRYSACAVEGVRGALTGLQVDAERMKTNLAATHGLIMAESLTMVLASHIGRPEAYRIVQAISKQVNDEGIDLRQATLDAEQIRAILSVEEIDNALDPGNYLGSTNTFINRVLETYHEIQQGTTH